MYLRKIKNVSKFRTLILIGIFSSMSMAHVSEKQLVDAEHADGVKGGGAANQDESSMLSNLIANFFVDPVASILLVVNVYWTSSNLEKFFRSKAEGKEVTLSWTTILLTTGSNILSINTFLGPILKNQPLHMQKEGFFRGSFDSKGIVVLAMSPMDQCGDLGFDMRNAFEDIDEHLAVYFIPFHSLVNLGFALKSLKSKVLEHNSKVDSFILSVHAGCGVKLRGLEISLLSKTLNEIVDSEGSVVLFSCFAGAEVEASKFAQALALGMPGRRVYAPESAAPIFTSHFYSRGGRLKASFQNHWAGTLGLGFFFEPITKCFFAPSGKPIAYLDVSECPIEE